VLRTLYDSAGISLNEAAARVGVDKSSLSRMMERLLDKELVTRTESAADRRAMQLKLSPAGRRLVPLLAAAADENDLHFFKSLPSARRQQFLQTVKDLLQANGWEQSARGADRLS